MNKKTIGTTIMCFFLALALASGGMLLDQYLDAKNSAETFDTLAEKVVEVTEPAVPDEETTEATEEELASQEAELAQQKYSALFEQNQDFIGWISIDGTNVNYPVMQTPNNPDYYLSTALKSHTVTTVFRILTRRVRSVSAITLSSTATT